VDACITCTDMSSQSVIIGGYCEEFGRGDVFFARDNFVYFNQVPSSSFLRQSCKIQYSQSVSVTLIFQILYPFCCRLLDLLENFYILHQCWTPRLNTVLEMRSKICFVKYSSGVARGSRGNCPLKSGQRQNYCLISSSYC